jgi:hypothetical protein
MSELDVQDIPCPHVGIQADVAVAVLVDDKDNVEGYNAAVRVWCGDCETPFIWKGVDVGVSPRKPMADISLEVLNVPLRPKDSPEDFGERLPGFKVSVHDGLDPKVTERNLAAVITNPSTMTPRKWNEPAESWAARAVMKVLEIQ